MVDATFMLPKVKKFSDWYSECHIDGISVYSRWSKACSGYSSTLVCEPNQRWNRLDQAELRAVRLDFSIMRTKAFINELNTFVKEFRTKLLIKEEGAVESEAWSLLTAMLSAIFKTMSAARAEAGNKPEDDPDLDSRAAKVFWGTWQCYRVMAQLLQVGFRKHPCVLPALTLNLFARKASSSKVNKMAACLAILEKSTKDSDHCVSQKAFDLFCSPTVEPLAKRIKALESKS